MLHSCDAGEYSVLTVYSAGFERDEYFDSNNERRVDLESRISAMMFHRFIPNGYPAK